MMESLNFSIIIPIFIIGYIIIGIIIALVKEKPFDKPLTTPTAPSNSERLIKLFQDFKEKRNGELLTPDQESERDSIVDDCLDIIWDMTYEDEAQAREFVIGLSDENLLKFFHLTNEPLLISEDRSSIYHDLIDADIAKKIFNAVETGSSKRNREIIEEFKSLIDKELLSPEIVIYIIAHRHRFRSAENIDPICNHFLAFFETTDNLDELEQMVLFWSEIIMPDLAKRKLRLRYVKAVNPKIRKNIEKALFFLGENPFSIVEGDQIMGDNFNLTGDFRGANVPVKSILKDVNVTINSNTNVDQVIKDKLEELIIELNETLQKIPLDMAEEAEAVARAAKILVETVAEKNPNKTMVQITSESLLKAAETLAKVMPLVLSIAKQVVALLIPKVA